MDLRYHSHYPIVVREKEQENGCVISWKLVCTQNDGSLGWGCMGWGTDIALFDKLWLWEIEHWRLVKHGDSSLLKAVWMFLPIGFVLSPVNKNVKIP